MTTSKIASAAAAASLAGVAVFGMAAPAGAQQTPCYPPPCAAAISDSTVTPGQTVTVSSGSGSFAAGATVVVTFPGTSTPSQTVEADDSGSANVTFTVASDARPGRYSVAFTSGGDTTSVAYTVVAAAAASPGRGQLPRTGADQVVPLTAAGIALVGIGGGIVVAARRRSSSLPAMPA